MNGFGKSRWASSFGLALVLPAVGMMAADAATNATANFQPPLLVKQRPSYYPLRAQSGSCRLEGAVTLEYVVNDKGQAVNPKVIRSSGSGLLDLSASYAIQTWEFRPARRHGRRTSHRCQQTIEFRPSAETPVAAAVQERAHTTRLPEYPHASIRAGRSGEVKLEVLVMPDGCVRDVTVTKSSGSIELDLSAAGTTYEYERVKGTGSTNRLSKTVTFQLH